MVTANSILKPKQMFTREDLRELVGAENGWRLSLFMPLVRTGRDVRQAPILLKDLRARASEALEERNASPAERDGILSVIDQILHEAETAVIQGEGMAIFASEHHAFAYLLPLRPESSVTVDRRFRLDPILPLLFEDGRFYLLALALKEIKLFEGDRAGLREVSLEGVTTDMRDALQFEDSESHLSFHTSTGSPGAGMLRSPMYFGHGGGKGDVKEMKRDILQFFHQLDAELKPKMADTGRPLLLAGVEMLLPIFREANSYPRILDASLPAHLDRFSGIAELHAQAWARFQREAKAYRTSILARYRERLATSDTAAGITEVVPLADQGRISHLFIRRGYQAAGTYDPSNGKVVVSGLPMSGDEDLVSHAAIQTIMGAGNVYAVEAGEIPGGADIAALCRY